MVFGALNRLIVAKIEAWKDRFKQTNTLDDRNRKNSTFKMKEDFSVDGVNLRKYLTYMLMSYGKYSEEIEQEDLKYVINLISIINCNLSTSIFQILKENDDLVDFLDYLQAQSIYFEQYHSPQVYYKYMLRSNSKIRLNDSGTVLKFLSLNSLLLAQNHASKVQYREIFNYLLINKQLLSHKIFSNEYKSSLIYLIYGQYVFNNSVNLNICV